MTSGVFDVLKELALSVKRMMDDAISKNVIRPETTLCVRWRVEEFQYTEGGITKLNARGERITKPTWFGAAMTILEGVKQLPEYKLALEQLTDAFVDRDRLSQDLESFMNKFVLHYLNEQRYDKSSIDSLTSNFLKDLRKEPLRYGAHVELQGVVLKLEKTEIDFGVTLRAPKIEDLEKEIPLGVFTTHPEIGGNLSAILDIEFLGRAANEIATNVHRSVALLRLFKVGSVRYLSYRMFSDSITDIMASGTLTAGQTTQALEKYLLTSDDLPKLKEFWQVVGKSIPATFYELGQRKTDHLTIAYDRYTDALLHNGILERRVMNSIMGLEALFLKGGETQELAYRLGTRIGKLFALLGYDQYKVREIISEAYRVRNVFAHGSQLTYRHRKRLESCYGDIRNLLLQVLDYLRVSLIVMILASKPKDEFVDLLDDLLIDADREQELKQVVSLAKGVF